MKVKRWIPLSELATTLIDSLKEAADTDSNVNDLKVMILDSDNYNLRINGVRFDPRYNAIFIDTTGYIEYYQDQIDKPSDI